MIAVSAQPRAAKAAQAERIATLDAIIQTLTLAIVLLIIGLTCVVIGVTGLVWISGRSRERGDRQTPPSTSGKTFAPTSARPRHEMISSRLSRHP